MARPTTLLIALGITQITSWGTTYYVFALLLTHLERDLGAGKSAITGAFSLSLLITGLLAPVIGRRIDRRGGRAVMSVGSVLAVIGLMALGRIESLIQLYVVWTVLGVAMAATLYEPAFAVLTQLFGERSRGAITVVTLFGGLASTVFWPVGQALIDSLGWRNTTAVLALINFALCLPVHVFLLPRRSIGRGAASEHHASAATGKALHEVLREASFYLVAAAFTANAVLLAAMSVYMLPMLTDKGLTPLQAAAVGAMFGPMQVAGRLIEWIFGSRFRAINVAIVAVTLMSIAMFIFPFLGPTPSHFIVFVALLGAGNGVTTIVRGIVPAELFGRKHYGAVNGAMAAPILIARASGPLVAALIWSAAGNYSTLALALAAIGAVSTVLFIPLVLRARRDTAIR